MDNAAKFRQYAEDCRRLAAKANEKDRVALLEIAQAWIVCAEDLERRARNKRKDESTDA